MNSTPERDVEKTYPLAEFIAKLRCPADALQRGERNSLPARAICSIEHEREGTSKEIEFQIKWENPQ